MVQLRILSGKMAGDVHIVRRFPFRIGRATLEQAFAGTDQGGDMFGSDALAGCAARDAAEAFGAVYCGSVHGRAEAVQADQPDDDPGAGGNCGFAGAGCLDLKAPARHRPRRG